jgi:hypothetical protein
MHHRENGSSMKDPQSIPYALVISLTANEDEEFYNRIVRNYGNILVPLRPQIQIPVKTTN